MTGRNPNGHYKPVRCSSTWDSAVAKPAHRQLSKDARARLGWLDWHASHGRNVTKTCERFGISRPTFYRWLSRGTSYGPAGLEDRSHRPHTVRKRTWTPDQVEVVRALREQYPRWSKDKRHVVLKREGIVVSASMIGRILTSLKARGLLHEPPRRTTDQETVGGTPLCHAQTQRLDPYPAWRLGGDRHQGCPTSAGESVQASLAGRRRQPVCGRRDRHERDSSNHQTPYRTHARSAAIFGPCYPDRRWQRVQRRIRGVLPRDGAQTVRLAAPLSEIERVCRADPTDLR